MYQQDGYNQQYPPQQGGYPPQQGGYPPQQGGYPPQQGGYPPQDGGYPPHGGGQFSPTNSPGHGHGHGHGRPAGHGPSHGHQQGPPVHAPAYGNQGYPHPGSPAGGPIGANWAVTINVGLKNNVLYPGNIVEGVVSISTKAPVNFNAIRLKFCGKEKIHIQRNERIPDGPPRPPANNPQAPPIQHYKTIKRSYYNTNVILKQLVTLSGDLKYTPMGQGNYMMAPGNYSYPFAFQLPYDLPPSFSKPVSDDYASMVYYCKAYVDVPMARDAVYKTFFTVVRPMPVSQWSYRQPAAINRVFDVTCCCCIDKGKVSAAITMDRTCIAIDRDWLQLFADLDNTQCQEPIENLQVVLRHTLKYRAGGFSEVTSYTAGSKQLGTIIPAGQKGLVNGVIDLPRNLLPTFKTPNVESSYTITISMTIPWATDPCHSFPVVIGQSVDDSNVSPPIAFNELGTLKFTPARMPCQEFYYQIPPEPVYAFVPVNTWTPPVTAPYMPAPTYCDYHLPPPSWAQGPPPPPAYGQPNNYNYSWDSGYGQAPAPEYTMPPPATQPMGYHGPPTNNFSDYSPY